MDNVQIVPKTEMQQKESMKRKKETQPVGYAVKGYWIKEKKNIKVNGVEKEVTMIKDLVISPDEPLSEDQCVVNDSWGFITK